jgi:hypothetical protein
MRFSICINDSEMPQNTGKNAALSQKNREELAQVLGKKTRCVTNRLSFRSGAFCTT